MRLFDIDGDGEDEMVVGWSNGKVSQIFLISVSVSTVRMLVKIN